MSGVSGGGGMSASGGASGDATGGEQTFNFGSTIGGFNAPKMQDKNMPYYIGGALFIGLIFILKKK